MNYWLFIIPGISAFIGWLANWLLIKLLFRKIFPARQQQIAQKIGKLVNDDFSSSIDIEKKISDPSHLEKIMPLVEEHIDDFLRNRLKTEMPMIAMFIGDKTIGKLKTAFMKEIETLFPQIMKQFAGNLKTEFDLEQLIIQKIAGISPSKLEEIAHQNMGKQLRAFQLTGALIGFIIGVVNVLIIIFAY